MKHLKDIHAMEQFGRRIREIRLSKNMSQEALAIEAGLEYSQISRIERGIINTSISQAFTIAKALQINPQELFIFSK